MQAIWNEALIAESNETIELEGNQYFPADSVSEKYVQPSDTHTMCPWKGLASYYDIVVDGEVNQDAAWYYKEPSEAAAKIKGYVAFWKGVEIK